MRLTDCIEWGGTIHREGYGVRYEGRRTILAHREAFEQAHGAIPDGLCVLHECDNRRCVNPAHLFLGTRADNARDRDRKGRQAKGEQNGQARITAEVVRAIRAARGSQSAIAARFGVSQQHVSDIRGGRRWAHV